MTERDSHRYTAYGCLCVGVPLALFNRSPVAAVALAVAGLLNFWIARRLP